MVSCISLFRQIIAPGDCEDFKTKLQALSREILAPLSEQTFQSLIDNTETCKQDAGKFNILS